MYPASIDAKISQFLCQCKVRLLFSTSEESNHEIHWEDRVHFEDHNNQGYVTSKKISIRLKSLGKKNLLVPYL